MLKRWINGEIALGFLLATLLWIAVLGLATSYAPTEVEKKACYDAAKQAGHQTEDCKTFWEKTTSDPVAMFTLVLALSTVGLWIATLALYVAGNRHSERQLRAYVLVKGAQLRKFGTAELPEAVVVIRNFGQTPAYAVDSFVGIAAHNYPLTIKISAPEDLKTVESILAPGGEHIFRVPTLRTLAADEVGAIISGEAAIYVVGKIAYIDAFKKARITNFLLFYGGEVGVAPDGLMAPYETGNDAT
jgi:hypothetical protein